MGWIESPTRCHRFVEVHHTDVGDVGPTYIYRSMDEIILMVNVGTYTIHESCGIYFKIFVVTR